MTDQTKNVLTYVASVLLRCWIFGFVLLLIWFGAIQFLGGVIFKLHGPMFGLSTHELDVIFYCGLGLLKLCVVTFFFIPWLAIKHVLRQQSS